MIVHVNMSNLYSTRTGTWTVLLLMISKSLMIKFIALVYQEMLFAIFLDKKALVTINETTNNASYLCASSCDIFYVCS